MKATIITFHCTPNFGATLQTIAMYKLFSKYFEKVEVLDYRPSYVTEKYNYLYLKRFRGFVASLLNVPTNIVKYKRFRDYLNSEVKLTKRFFKADDIRINSDCLILGSDQIWNFDIAGYDDTTYFGKIKNNSSSIIAYAASIGNDTVSKQDMEQYKLLVSKIDCIGVRENRAKEILQESGIDKEIDVVLDPTLLISKEEWREQEHKISGLPDKYILVYSLLGYDETYHIAEKISIEKNIPIIEILGRNIDLLDKHKHRKIATAGPREFIYAIDNASYVVTDSFHGTAFSIIFSKKFLVVPHKTRGSRMIELLSKLNLQNRIVKDNYLYNDEELLYSDDTITSLSEKIEQSNSFIKNSINKI